MNTQETIQYQNSQFPIIKIFDWLFHYVQPDNHKDFLKGKLDSFVPVDNWGLKVSLDDVLHNTSSFLYNHKVPINTTMDYVLRDQKGQTYARPKKPPSFPDNITHNGECHLIV